MDIRVPSARPDAPIGAERSEPGIHPARFDRLRSRSGFSLIELIVAMMILTVGLLGLAAGTGYVIRSSEMGRVDTERAQARQSAVELIRSRDFNSFQPEADVEIGRHTLSWEIADTQQTDGGQVVSYLVNVTMVGPGRGEQGPVGNVAETFQYRFNRPGG